MAEYSRQKMDLENWVDFDNWAFSGIKYDIFSRLMVLADCYFAKFKVNEIGIGMKSMKHVFDNFFSKYFKYKSVLHLRAGIYF